MFMLSYLAQRYPIVQPTLPGMLFRCDSGPPVAYTKYSVVYLYLSRYIEDHLKTVDWLSVVLGEPQHQILES